MASSPEKYRKYLRFSTVGLELGFSVMIGLFVGQWLDKTFGTEPWLLLICLLFGMVAGFRGLIRLLKSVTQDNSDQE